MTDPLTPYLDTQLQQASNLPSEKGRIAYRELALQSGMSSRVLTEYGKYLIRKSQARAAEEILALALEADGANVDALEQYMAVLDKIEAHSSRQRWALRRLEESVVATPSAHRSALDYMIPHRLERALKFISDSPDPLVRAAVAINESFQNKSTTNDALEELLDGMSQVDRDRAMLIVALGRGKSNLVENILEYCDVDSLPADSIRRAIRRSKRMRKPEQTEVYLRAHLRLQPNDNWGLQQLQEVAEEHTSNYQLAHRGFPFPPGATHPSSYAPRENKVFYLLYNSLPFHSAGYATRSQGLIRELNNSGWDVDGVTRLAYPYDMKGFSDIPDVEPVEEIDGVSYRRLLLPDRQIMQKNPMYPYSQQYSAALEELARQERPNVIHAASNYVNGVTAIQSARRLGVPSVYEIRGLWEVTRISREPEWERSTMFQHMVRMETDAANAATSVVTITEALRQEMIRRGVDGEKISVVPNGVDTDRFTPIPRDVVLAEKLGIQDKIVIGYVGSILDYEGLDLLLQAVKELAEERDDFHVLIIGDGPELPKLKNFVRDYALDHAVTFTGRVPHEDVESYYSIIDVAPFPRLPLPVCEMVSPLKPFEAMAMGKTIVASDVAALAEIVKPGVNGLLHRKGEVDDLRDQLDHLLEHPELITSIGEQARDWVVENRDWKILAAQISSLYHSLTI